MNLLFDTHTFLWHAESSPRMSTPATLLLNDPANALFLSIASAWEIAIKVGIKKLTLSTPYPQFMRKAIANYRITVIPITTPDCAAYEQLPFPNPNHRDPFDRMIITHAQRNGLSIVGCDIAFDAYGVTRLW